MKSPSGFGKKYFTLASILAHAIAPKLHSITTTYKSHESLKILVSDETSEDDPPSIEEQLLSCFTQYNKPCHCDCVFRRKTKLVVLLFRFIPRCLFYCKFFAFRRTGTHPPIALFS